MMPGLRYIALCLTVGGLLNGITPVAGQPVATPLSDPPIHTRYTHRAWTTDDGLPQNAASALVQTRDGYLWIGTYQGLARFDGVRFTVFEAATTDGLDSDRITTLLEDQDGDLWIGTDTGGLSRYRNGRFTAFAEFEGLPHRSVFRLFEDYNGTLWVRTVTGPIVHEEQRNSRTHFVSDPRFSDTNVIAIHASVTEPGTLWGATKQGVMRLRAGERKIVLGASDVNSIVEQADGTLWFGAGNTVRRLKNGQVDSYPIPQGYSEQLFVDRSDTVWALANGSGLYYFNGAGFTKLSLPNDPIGTTVVSMLEDREGTLWVGTIAQGLHQLRERLFRSYTVEDGLPGQQILGVHEDDEGAIWAGTTSNGLVRIHEGAVHTFTTEDGLPHNRVWATYADPTGTLWIGMDGHLARFDGRAFERVPILLAPSTVRVFEPAASGGLWLGGNGGVSRLQNKQVVPVLDKETLPSSIAISLYEAPGGTLWIGTNGGGLCRYDPIRPLTCYTTADGLSNAIIRAIFPAGKDTLWIGTYGSGLCQFAEEQFTCLTKQHGLPDGTIHHILEDNLGFLWMSSNKGIFRVARQEVEDFFRGARMQIYPDLYTEADGMPSSECNGGFQPAAWKARDGQLWFPTTKGLAVVDPETAAARQTTPDLPVYLEQFTVDGTPVAEQADLTLPPGSDRLIFSFTTPYLSAPRKLRFRYRLQGHETQWIEADASRNATYTNLSPGTYAFQVEASVGSGAWHRKALPFVLKPHVYQTAWFWSLCILGGLIFLGLTYRRHLHSLKRRQHELESLVTERTERLRAEKRKTEEQARRLEELDQAKNRFFANVSHEFRTPLQLITGPLEEELARTDDPRLHRQLATAHRSAHRMLHLVNQLLDLAQLESGTMTLHPEPGNLADFLHTLVQTFMPLAERKHITLHTRSDASPACYLFDQDKLEKIVGNLLANALKFTPEGGKVWVTLHATSGQNPVEITVKDTGPGIPAAALPHIFERFRQADDSTTRTHEGSGIGLALARELVEVHSGEIFAESEPGFGTIFTVRLPLRADEGETGFAQASAAPASLKGTPALMTAPDEDVHSQQIPSDAPTVLLVEDNAEVRRLVRGYLEPDYQVMEAEQGQAGLDAARANPPDLILSDVMMPVMDGLMLVQAVKTDDRLRAIPVILLTARAAVQDTVEGLEAGADDYLPKPFTAAELRARVARHIEARQQLRTQFSQELRVEPSGISVSSEEEVFLRQILETVEVQMGNALFGATALAEAVGLSPRQLRRRLRSTMDESPAALIRRLRLERAAQLIESRAGTVAEIAYRVGFNDPDYFSTSYRKHFGHPPTDTPAA